MEREDVPTNLKDEIKITASKKTLFLPHAIRQMNKPERMISEAEVIDVILRGEIIEDYPEDVRGQRKNKP